MCCDLYVHFVVGKQSFYKTTVHKIHTLMYSLPLFNGLFYGALTMAGHYLHNKKSKSSSLERDNWYHLVQFIKGLSGEEALPLGHLLNVCLKNAHCWN